MKGITAILVHVAGWLAFLSLPTMFRPHYSPTGLLDVVRDITTGPRLPNTILLITVFYFIYCLVVPEFYFRKKYVSVAFFIALCFSALVALNYGIGSRKERRHNEYLTIASIKSSAVNQAREVSPWSNSTFKYLGPDYNLFMFLIAVGLSFSLPIYGRMRKLSERQLNAELTFLKEQVNPHFLFNTLNSIYSLTLARSDAAPDAVLKLSGIMRYAMNETKQEYVSLEQEIGYIDNYIELQKLRVTGKAKISFVTEGETGGKQIAPFMLAPFVENAFKYGINPAEDSEIRVEIRVEGNEVYLDVFNTKVFLRKDKNSTPGLSIDGIRQRLELLYPGRHKLSVTNSEKKFSVSLFIKLK